MLLYTCLLFYYMKITIVYVLQATLVMKILVYIILAFSLLMHGYNLSAFKCTVPVQLTVPDVSYVLYPMQFIGVV